MIVILILSPDLCSPSSISSPARVHLISSPHVPAKAEGARNSGHHCCYTAVLCTEQLQAPESVALSSTERGGWHTLQCQDRAWLAPLLKLWQVDLCLPSTQTWWDFCWKLSHMHATEIRLGSYTDHLPTKVQYKWAILWPSSSILCGNNWNSWYELFKKMT